MKTIGTMILGGIIGAIATLLLFCNVNNQIYGQILNSTHYRFENGTIVSPIPEETVNKIANELINKAVINMTQSSFPGQSGDALKILSSSSYTDEAGYFHVVGEVKNNSPSTLNFVQVTGTFYDVSNKVVGTTFTFTNPSNIIAGETAPFDLVLLAASVPMSEINTYKVSANAQ